MSGTDDRIVSMQFDNAEFERKLAETMKSLDKFQQSLKFKDSAQGLEDVQAAASKFNLGAVGDSIENVSGKFLALSTVAITAISKITGAAIDAGTKIVKAFAIQPIMDGFQEFETNMTSIQTILANTASKGTKLNDVNAALDDLNHYSDQTIYNFGQMAKNIGTFTAAGVDLKTSTASIKGIANLAALSGSSADQAATAMYQLSQAIASGSVKLMDWNSVVNAGLGGETFQKALFESGKAMKTLTDVPAGQTFEQWKKAGNSFRDSLQSGWITSEVLTKTLQGFTGDLTAAQIQAMGYTKAQADEMVKLGNIGKDAATKVKTLTQLVSTVKEAVGSGWSESFRTVIGNFDESSKLFTDINNAIGKFVQSSADARNNLLSGWKNLGGRTLLIQAFTDAIKGIGTVIKPIKDAFREVFPPETAQGLMNLTEMFARFAKHLAIGAQTAQKVHDIFAGLFSVFDIVKTIVKELAFSIGIFFQQFSGGGSTILDLAAKLGVWLQLLDKMLVTDGGIRKFFMMLDEFARKPVDAFKALIGVIGDFFKSFDNSDAVGKGIDRVESRFGGLFVLPDRFMDMFNKVQDILSRVWSYIADWFSKLGKEIASVLKPGDFDTAVDIVNVGLLGGITMMLRKFLSGGIKIDVGGGFADKLKAIFSPLTDTLKSLQAQLKAKTLMEIAGAIALMTVSIVALSLVDSAALTKALTAIAVGFGELIGVMKLLDKMGKDTKGAATLDLLTGAMIALSTSAVILAGAIAILAQLSWEQLTKGLAGIAGGLAILVGAVKLLGDNSVSIIIASTAMIAIATSLVILSGAVALFGNMDWGTLAKGFIAVAVGLGIIAGVMQIMPVASTIAAGAAMIPLATGITILAGAVKIFASMSLVELAKGLGAVGVGLVLIAGAMSLMPLTLPLTAAGLVLVGIGLNEIAAAVAILGNMKMGDLVKGLGAVAVVLTILAVATNAMDGALPGAAAILVVAASLVILAGVIKELGKLSIAQIITGLAAIAGVLIVLGVAALVMEPVIPSLFALGIALGLIGVSFALFGAGAFLAAKAFQVVAETGKAAIDVLIEAIISLIKAIPRFVTALIESLAETATELFKAGDLIVRVVGVFLLDLLDLIIKLTPKIAQAIVGVITAGLELIREKFPDIVATGIELFKNLLTGILQNIGDITNLAVQIIVTFAEALGANAQKLVDAAVNLLASFVSAVVNRMNDIVGLGVSILLALLSGMANNLFRIINFVGDLITAFVQTIGGNVGKVVDAAANVIVKFAEGLGKNVNRVITAGADLILNIIQGISSNVNRVVSQGADIIIDFINKLADTIRTKSPQLIKAFENLGNAIIAGLLEGVKAGVKKMGGPFGGVLGGIVDQAEKAFGVKSPSTVFMAIGENVMKGLAIGLTDDQGSEDMVVTQAENIVAAFQKSLSQIPDSLAGMDELNPVITPVLDLTKIQTQAKSLDTMLGNPTITPDVSTNQAQLISTATTASTDTTDTMPAPPSTVTFEQNIYSPTALSTNDIYRNTKSQIAIAKEELNIA